MLAPGDRTGIVCVVDPVTGTRADVDVGRGATIRSLTTADGFELFASGHPAADPLPPGDDFVRSGLTGYVDCLPTIEACTLPGLPAEPLGDHGALWWPPWSVVDEGLDDQRAWLTLAVDIVGWPMTFARSVLVSADRLRLEFRLRNKGQAALPALWAGHGLLHTPPGSSVVADGIDALLVTAASDDWPVREAEQVLSDLSDPHGRLDLAAVPHKGWAKAYGRWPAGGVWLERPDGAVHVQASGPTTGLWLGLWVNNGGFPSGDPVRHVALQPSTGNSDSLAEWVSRPGCWSMPAGEVAQWSMEYQLHPAGASGFSGEAERT